MRNRRLGKLWIVAVLLVLGLFIIVPRSSIARADTSPQGLVLQAWELAQRSGSYHFATRLEQTTYPAPTIANVGVGSRVESVYLDGSADLPGETLQMRMWQDGGGVGDIAEAAEVRIEGDAAYGRVTGGEWSEIDNFAGSIAPGNDALGFLVAARDIEQTSAESASADHSLHTAALSRTVTRFTFDLSGPALASFMRDKLEEQLRTAGKLPAGIRLDTSEELRDAVGSGDLWVNREGLPARMAIRIAYPQQSNGERIEVEIITDFSNFDRAAIAQSWWERARDTVVRASTSRPEPSVPSQW